MNSRGARCLILVAQATALIVLSCSTFAQTKTSQNGVSDNTTLEPAVTARLKDVVINARDSGQPPRAMFKPKAATIGFLPADILVPVEDARNVVPWQTFPSFVPPAVKKDPPAETQDDPATLAKKLLNPVSSLARVPFESNVDFGLAANREGYRYTMNIDPVIPFALNKNWNLISRTRIPLIQQDGIVESMTQAGLGDILQTFFISPSKSKPVFWGAGATLLIPTATDVHIGTGKFGIGPAVVIGSQHRSWTYGVLARHIWSVAGHSDRADVRSTYVQPFLAYTTRSAWTVSLDTESTYDWVHKEWSVPIHVEVSKVFRVAGHPVSVGAALTCWAGTMTGGPQACGARFTITPIFPAK